MKTYFNILFLLSLSTFVFGQETGRLNITSTPEGCWVRIDSILVGKTPLTDLEVAAGNHNVQIYPPQNGIWNVETRELTVTVSPNRSESLNATFANPVYINSVPYGAALYSDTSFISKTPVYLSYDEHHGQSFRLVKKGYKSYEFVLNSPNAVIAQLEKDDSFIATQHQPELLGVMPKQHFKSKFTLLAVSVATHWASFYLKNVADKKFEKYERASDPVLIDQYWNSTKKYDRLADISLGVSFASLAGLIYMVIWQ